MIDKGSKSVGLVNRCLNQIAKHHKVDLIRGNFPYCSYSVPSYISRGSGQWWDIEVSKDAILIPYLNKSNNINTILGFFHELGHIEDHRQGKQFKTQLDREKSAWLTGLRFYYRSGFSRVIDKEDVHKRVSYCLSTYM